MSRFTPGRLIDRLSLPRAKQLDPWQLTVLILAILYGAIFLQLATDIHAGMRTHKADLGQIDQAVWNSSRGRWLEQTDNGYVATRLTDHVEPILVLISPIFWIWNDVRALLLLQVAAMAVGALLLYALALARLDQLLPPTERGQIWQLEPHRQHTRPLAAALAIAFLLTPHLQSAVLTEFHAAPLAVPLILWAFWSVDRARWRQFIVAALLVAAVKEEMALLAAGLGVWAIWSALRPSVLNARSSPRTIASNVRRANAAGLWAGTGVIVVALVWFYVATFVIVPAHAQEVYGVAESGYFQRYGALGNSPIDIVKSFFTQPHLVWQIIMEPARRAYLVGLLAPFGLLALLAPEVLILALPVLLANLLSAYPAQYYGEFHYSAPLVPYVAVAATVAVSRLWRVVMRNTQQSSGSFQHMSASGAGVMAVVSFFTNARTALRPLLTILLCVWLVGWATASYLNYGRGPLAARVDPTPSTAHHRLLTHFTRQIPPDAAVTATAAVHPHVSHRRYVYQFPMGVEGDQEGHLGNAAWALLDVTTNTDMAPGDLRARVDAMLAGAWGVVDGADGFLLLQRGAQNKEIPASFYDFARMPLVSTGASTDAVPAAPLTLVDVAVHDWPRWRQTTLIGKWLVGTTFDPARHEPRLDINSPAGQRIMGITDVTPPALIWYPPTQWQPGDIVTITSLHLYLPGTFGIMTDSAALQADIVSAAPERTQTAPANEFVRGIDDMTAVNAYQRSGGDQLKALSLQAASGQSVWPVTQEDMSQFNSFVTARLRQDDGMTLGLRAQLASSAAWPGKAIDVGLQWQDAAAWPEQVSVFVHLRRANANMAQNDGQPRYFVVYAPAEQLATKGRANDWRQLIVPDDAQAGETWQVVVGLYDTETGARLEVDLDNEHEPVGGEAGVGSNEVIVGDVFIGAPPTPDQSCALLPATCASQPH